MMWKMFYNRSNWGWRAVFYGVRVFLWVYVCELHRSKCNSCKTIIHDPCHPNAVTLCTTLWFLAFKMRKGNPLDNAAVCFFLFIDNFNNLIIKLEKKRYIPLSAFVRSFASNKFSPECDFHTLCVIINFYFTRLNGVALEVRTLSNLFSPFANRMARLRVLCLNYSFSLFMMRFIRSHFSMRRKYFQPTVRVHVHIYFIYLAKSS